MSPLLDVFGYELPGDALARNQARFSLHVTERVNDFQDTQMVAQQNELRRQQQEEARRQAKMEADRQAFNEHVVKAVQPVADIFGQRQADKQAFQDHVASRVADFAVPRNVPPESMAVAQPPHGGGLVNALGDAAQAVANIPLPTGQGTGRDNRWQGYVPEGATITNDRPTLGGAATAFAFPQVAPEDVPGYNLFPPVTHPLADVASGFTAPAAGLGALAPEAVGYGALGSAGLGTAGNISDIAGAPNIIPGVSNKMLGEGVGSLYGGRGIAGRGIDRSLTPELATVTANPMTAEDIQRAGMGIAGASGKVPPLAKAADAGAAATEPLQQFARPSVLKSVDEISKDIFNSTHNYVGGLAEMGGNVPGIRGIIHAVNPTALVENPPPSLVKELGQEGAQQLMGTAYAYGRKLDEAGSLAYSVEASIRQELRRVGLTTKDGLLTSKAGQLGLVGDVFENPSRYALTPEQRGLVDRVQGVLEDMNAAEKANSVPKGEIFSAEGRYFPRQRIDLEALQIGSVRRTVGATQPFQKGRLYETMADGAANGVDYNTDAAALVGARLRAGMKAISDKQAAELLRPLGDTFGQGGPNFGTRAVNIPALAGTAYPHNAAQFISDAFTETPASRGLVGAANSVNSFLRTIEATGDLSYSFIQNLVGSARNPIAGFKAIGYGIDSLLLDGRLYGKYIQNNAPWIERFVRANGTLGGTEFSFENIIRNRSIQGLMNRVTGRFDRAFTHSANVAALEHFKAFTGIQDATGNNFGRLARKFFGDFGVTGNDETAASLANKLAGRVSSRGLGVGPIQREVEATLTFAPRFYRAVFGMLGDAVQGGMRGAEARRTLASFAVGGTSLYVGTALALGQKPNLDPSKTGFMTVNVGGQQVGFGGPLLGLVRVMGQIAADPAKLGEVNIRTNPALRWARGRTAPVFSMAIDLASGKDYIGNDVPVPNSLTDVSGMAQAAEYGGMKAMPFGAQTAITEGPIGAAAQFGGLRSFPQSAMSSSQFWDIPRWQGVDKKDENAVFELMAAARSNYSDIKANNKDAPVTEADVARSLGRENPRIAALAAAALGNRLQPNGARVNFAIQHQDDLDGNALNSVLDAEMARSLRASGVLSKDNFQKWQDAQVRQ